MQVEGQCQLQETLPAPHIHTKTKTEKVTWWMFHLQCPVDEEVDLKGLSALHRTTQQIGLGLKFAFRTQIFHLTLLLWS